MKLNLLFVVFAVLTCIISCNQGPPRSHVEYETVKSDSGEVILKRTFDRKNRLVINESLNIDSLNDGEYLSYYRNGNVKLKGQFKSGKKEGTWMRWDSLGKLVYNEAWFQGKNFGEQLYYNPDGILKDYLFLNLQEGVLYHAKFENNKIVSDSGAAVYIAYTGERIANGSEFEILVFWGTPPGKNYNISVKESFVLKDKVVRDSEYFKNDKIEDVIWGKRFTLLKIYNQTGNYEWEIDLLEGSGKHMCRIGGEKIKLAVVKE